jgi:hypothetical protein
LPGFVAGEGRAVPLFNRSKMTYYPLKERVSKLNITETCIAADSWDRPIQPQLAEKAKTITEEIICAQQKGASVICTFGAHTIKNGLGRMLGQMLANGWFTHLASNGAAVIHDWEFAFLGKSSEDVRLNAAEGRFGTWEETGLYINLALALGAYQGLGYGASVGKMICDKGLHIPEREELLCYAENFMKKVHNSSAATASLAAISASVIFDLYELIETLNIPSGFLSIPHQYCDYSLLAATQQSERPLTCHPMFGHDIIYTHIANRGAVIGRTAEKDFLEYVSSVTGLEGGVYLSVGSAVMSPMIFEKALSMARNTADGKDAIKDINIHVVDIQKSSWDWSKGEPPADNPAYYLRFMKSFNRMGCKVDYTCADNRDFFVSLYRSLQSIAAKKEKI